MGSSSRNLYAGIGEGQSTSRPPLFDGTNYTYWKERMRIYIRSTNFQLWLVIKNGEETPMKKVDEKLVPKTEDEFDAEDIKKVENYAKAINMLYCAINPDDYRKISCCTTAKEMWDKLEVTYEGTDQVREAKIDFLTQEYEMFRMKEGEKIDDMFDRFSKIINDLHALKKTYTNRDLVRKILRSLTPEWRSKADTIYESIGVSNVTIDGLRGNLKTYESTILTPSLDEQKKKGIALKATKESVEDDSSDDDNEFGLVIKKFHKVMKKEFERKGRKHDGPPKCYGCGEIGHIKPRCPKSKGGKDKPGFKKQRAYISWGGDSGDESTDQEEEEAANLCLMAHEDQTDNVQEFTHNLLYKRVSFLSVLVFLDTLRESISLVDSKEGLFPLKDSLSVDESIQPSIVSHTIAFELWDDLQKRYSCSNGPRIYQLKSELSSLRQKRQSVVSYFNQFITLWNQLHGSKDPTNGCKCAAAAITRAQVERDKTIDFLLGLDDEQFGHIRLQIMATEPVPDIDRAYSLISQEERHQSIVRSRDDRTDSVAFAARSDRRPPPTGKFLCSHCGRTSHTVETFYELIGFPTHYNKGPGGRGSSGSSRGGRGSRGGGSAGGHGGRGSGGTPAAVPGSSQPAVTTTGSGPPAAVHAASSDAQSSLSGQMSRLMSMLEASASHTYSVQPVLNPADADFPVPSPPAASLGDTPEQSSSSPVIVPSSSVPTTEQSIDLVSIQSTGESPTSSVPSPPPLPPRTCRLPTHLNDYVLHSVSTVTPSSSSPSSVSSGTRFPITNYVHYNKLHDRYKSFVGALDASPVPTSYREAVRVVIFVLMALAICAPFSTAVEENGYFGDRKLLLQLPKKYNSASQSIDVIKPQLTKGNNPTPQFVDVIKVPTEIPNTYNRGCNAFNRCRHER
ncbi:unnamed protein product [Cuscuta campestris]|uniref:CCHC-type domain-containing protein n=1 Tax=Cuscuta campestris TaxID=132261 RepID=A0A484KRZ7_9ASTE|nr:unnamed protein product [Cuscuta campestris]